VTSLGELTASIAHEINQPLGAIVANATAGINWLARSNPDLGRAHDTLVNIARDGERAADVLARIRALLTRSTVSMAPCDIRQVVEDVVSLMRGQLSRDQVVLQTKLDEALPRVVADVVQLQQVILNLVLNAAEASREVEVSRRRIVVHASADGQNVVVAVEDSGVGFDGVDTARLFNTFFTTKSTGLGMGLSISRSIIERHGGRMWFEPNVVHGATFHFSLPPAVRPSGD
jgi:signal transduction histidine kinase